MKSLTRQRLSPSRHLIGVASLFVLLAIGTAFFPAYMSAFLVFAAITACVALIDALWLLLLPSPALTRDMPHAFPLGQWRDITLDLMNNGKRGLKAELFDLHPAIAVTEGLPATLRLAGGTETRVTYRLRCDRRGTHRFDGVHVRITSPLALFTSTRTLGDAVEVRVYPDFAAVARYALLATDNRLSQLGIRRRQRRGEGLDFHQLREYRQGDALRQIDWKATSRLQKLISRDYQDERDQQVAFLLDCGFRMRAQDSSLSHFDAALNALLLMAYVVQRQGDAAGCMTFAGNAGDDRWFAPAKGREQMSRLMNGLFDLEPTSRTPDFRATATTLAARLHKRSLVVLITNLRDEDVSDLVAGAKLLGERHLVLVATLRETVLDELLAPDQDAHAISSDDAIRIAATRLYVQQRERALQRLTEERLLVVDCTPTQLPVRLVNAYLDIKRSGRL